ncbi:MAG: hypothetical protein CML29_00700 [Rhizobiales bacterium]|nr:hypothetical protein [Hyphomicrobiales bacterium]|tara:strand:- start:582 stop:1274 length:693 start_codon:yes stop_codon:yes gene_type:complete
MKHEIAVPAHVEPEDDLYYTIHKGLRMANARMLIALGQADPTSMSSVAGTLSQLREHLQACEKHLQHENEFVHSALNERLPGGSGHADEDHEEHERTFAELRQMIGAIEAATTERSRLWRNLYQRFALFFAEDLEHMHEEETEVMPLIAAHFTKDEMKAIEGRIIASIPPAELVEGVRMMLQASSSPEREAMVRGMQDGMPGEVFDGFMSAVTRGTWRLGDFSSLERGLW